MHMRNTLPPCTCKLNMALIKTKNWDELNLFPHPYLPQACWENEDVKRRSNNRFFLMQHTSYITILTFKFNCYPSLSAANARHGFSSASVICYCCHKFHSHYLVYLLWFIYYNLYTTYSSDFMQLTQQLTESIFKRSTRLIPSPQPSPLACIFN